jgi:flotillin
MSTANERTTTSRATDRPSLRAVESDEHLPVVPDLEIAWRAGRPAEDPEKTKRWGFITAKPSEYLIHMRRGRIRPRGTGQGASCFKWPWDSVSIIPTTINRLQFSAEQVTLEKVGVRVTGLAVYRIVAPEIAFRMLNFSFAERASEKLAEIMREMFVGATRRHVANLGVEDVMTRRKDGIAGDLMAELAPVLAGRGRSEDATSMGWGVVLDTVEIQDVRVMSEEVFANMQATFRAELAARARTAELERSLQVAARETEHARQIEIARIETETETRTLRASAHSRTTEIELAEEERSAELRARAEHARIERERTTEVARRQAQAEIENEERRQAELTRRGELEREARLVEVERALAERRHELELRQAALEHERLFAAAITAAERREAQSEADAKLQMRDMELERASGELRHALARAAKDIEDTISDGRIRMELVSRTMPAMAEAFAHQIGELRMTQIGTSADPSSMIAHGLGAVVELARSLGLQTSPTGSDTHATPAEEP